MKKFIRNGHISKGDISNICFKPKVKEKPRNKEKEFLDKIENEKQKNKPQS